MDYYHAQTSYFQDGLKTIEHFNSYILDLSTKISVIKAGQDEERRQLSELRGMLRSCSPMFDSCSTGGSPNQHPGAASFFAAAAQTAASAESAGQLSARKDRSAYNLHQLQGNTKYGYTKTGYLFKKPDKKMRMKAWHKRRCEIRDGFLSVYHSDEAKLPAKINLLTCQVKPSSDEKKAFDLISFARTYHFQAEDEYEAEAWVSVLINCNKQALKKEFDSNGDPISQGFGDLRRSIIAAVFRLPGNDRCVDCGSRNDCTWFSTNFGVLLCIECSGIHRDLGVHISRVQSLTLDNIGTAQLLLAKHMSNAAFNEVFEASCDPTEKIRPESSMDQRFAFVRSKYVNKRFVRSIACGDAVSLRINLEQAILNKNLYQLLQCFGENADLTCVLPGQADRGDSPLHLAIALEDNCSLFMVDFLVQNSKDLNCTNADGNTPLHVCVLADQSEAMKLLLKAGANTSLVNSLNKTPLQLAVELNRSYLFDLLEQSKQDEKTMFEYVNVNWNLAADDASTDFSDEDQLDDKLLTKEYYDWLFNGSTNSIMESIQHKQKDLEARNARKHSISSFEPMHQVS